VSIFLFLNYTVAFLGLCLIAL